MRKAILSLMFIGLFCSSETTYSESAVEWPESLPLAEGFVLKPPPTWAAQPEFPPVRQGGDTIENAFPISLPFFSSGTTIGFSNDYEVSCPYFSLCPDVVYSFQPTNDVNIVVDLFGSDYDTKVFIFDGNLQPIACNDDFYIPSYVSLLQMVTLSSGVQYYIVVDGYDGPGDYQISILENQLDIPENAIPEGEPTLFPGYVDEYNSACAIDPEQPLIQELNGDASGGLYFHGHLGYINPEPFIADTDWFSLVIGESGVVEVEFSAQIESKLYHFEPPDCQAAELVQSVTARFGHPGSMTISGEPLSVVWLSAGVAFYAPSGYDEAEYSYLLSVSGLVSGTVETEALSWGAVKSRFR